METPCNSTTRAVRRCRNPKARFARAAGGESQHSHQPASQEEVSLGSSYPSASEIMLTPYNPRLLLGGVPGFSGNHICVAGAQPAVAALRRRAPYSTALAS